MRLIMMVVVLSIAVSSCVQYRTITTTPTGKPDNCEDTYLPGHRGYAENKDQWDDFSAQTDGVCQSQYGRGVPSPCVYVVQLSVDGNPYYLCWYNN